jgi:hypothetical protein
VKVKVYSVGYVIVIHNDTRSTKHQSSYQYSIRPQFSRCYQKHCGDLSPLDFYLRVHLKPLVYSAAIQNEKTRQPSFFMPVKSFAIAPRPLKSYGSPSSEVSMHASIQVEESDVNCYFLNTNNSKVIKWETCAVSVLCKL